jgi:benzoyl-CoA-dihydrodiol lyase
MQPATDSRATDSRATDSQATDSQAAASQATDSRATDGRASSEHAADGQAAEPEVSFDTEPGRYRHWTLAVDGQIATLSLDVAEDGGLVPGYELKMNSYDLGVDIELYDVQRLRFEHPGVRAVVLTSGKGEDVLALARTSGCWRSRRIAGR